MEQPARFRADGGGFELAELAPVAGDGPDANPDGKQMRLDIVQLDVW